MSAAEAAYPSEGSSDPFTSPAGALKTADAALDYFNSAAAGLDGLACGELRGAGRRGHH